MPDALLHAVRGALQLAIAEGTTITLVLRGDAAAGVPVRTIEGVPNQITLSRDGRERVHVRVAEGTEQQVLLDRIVRVLRGEASVSIPPVISGERPTVFTTPTDPDLVLPDVAVIKRKDR